MAKIEIFRTWSAATSPTNGTPTQYRHSGTEAQSLATPVFSYYMTLLTVLGDTELALS